MIQQILITYPVLLKFHDSCEYRNNDIFYSCAHWDALIDCVLQRWRPQPPATQQRPFLVVARGIGTKSLFCHGDESSSPHHWPAGKHGPGNLSVPGGLQKLADAETKDELNRYRWALIVSRWNSIKRRSRATITSRVLLIEAWIMEVASRSIFEISSERPLETFVYLRCAIRR